MIFSIIYQEITATVVKALRYLLSSHIVLVEQLATNRCRNDDRDHIHPYVYTKYTLKILCAQ